VFKFISAAADVDMAQLRQLMAQGVSPNVSDYDKRTAMMVAAHEGHDVSGHNGSHNLKWAGASMGGPSVLQGR